VATEAAVKEEVAMGEEMEGEAEEVVNLEAQREAEKAEAKAVVELGVVWVEHPVVAAGEGGLAAEAEEAGRERAL
jgi:hypothetical protein